MEKIPYLRSLLVECDDAATFFIMDNPIRSGSYLFVQSISVEDETSGADAVRFGRGTDENEPHWWEEQRTVAVGTIRWVEKELHIVPEGQRVILRVDGAEVDDLIRVEIEGYLTGKVRGAKPFESRKRTDT